MSSSVTTSAPVRAHEATSVRRLYRRLLLFFSPFLVALGAIAFIGVSSGELLSAKTVVWLQSFGRPFLYLPKLSDRNFAFKLEATVRRKPEVLALGQSRSNQWRSAMFNGAFYNAAQAGYSFEDEEQFISSLAEPLPKVLILAVDFYQFDAKWNSLYKKSSKNDFDYLSVVDVSRAATSLVQEAFHDPALIFNAPREPLYELPAIGLSAIRFGWGFRLDGSFQYGPEIRGDFEAGASVEEALDRVSRGMAPFLATASIDEDRKTAFARLISLIRKRGIAVVGITTPFAPEVVRRLEVSSNHQIWREFRSKPFQDWIRSQGVLYYDFTEIDSFGGRENEFVDAFHPSEPAYVRMLLKMLADSETAGLFPGTEARELEARLNKASVLEMFRNEF